LNICTYLLYNDQQLSSEVATIYLYIPATVCSCIRMSCWLAASDEIRQRENWTADSVCVCVWWFLRDSVSIRRGQRSTRARVVQTSDAAAGYRCLFVVCVAN